MAQRIGKKKDLDTLLYIILIKFLAPVSNAGTKTATIKSTAQRRLGSSSQKIMGQTIEELSYS